MPGEFSGRLTDRQYSMTTAILPTGEVPDPPLAYEYCETAQPFIVVVDDDARTRRFVRAVVACAMSSADTVADVMEAEISATRTPAPGE
jgi:hypothetical protein